MLLTGSYRRSLDEKQRLSLPKQIRDILGLPDRTRLYLTPGTDRSLGLYTEEGLEALGQRLAQSSPASRDVRAFSRLFYAQAQGVDPDRQGRIRVPQELAALASLGTEVMLLGVRDHLELWDLAAWEKFVAETQPQFDSIAVSAFGGPAESGFQEGNSLG